MNRKIVSLILALALCLDLTNLTFAAGNVGDTVVTDSIGRDWKLSEPILAIKEIKGLHNTVTTAYVVPLDTHVTTPMLDMLIVSGDYEWTPESIYISGWRAAAWDVPYDFVLAKALDDVGIVFLGDSMDDPSTGVYFYVVDGTYTDENTSNPSSSNLNGASSWAVNGISSAIDKGFVPTDLQKDYTNTITRAEFCRMAVKFVEYKTGKNIEMVLQGIGVSRNQSEFTDTNDNDILAASALGITSGTGNHQFTPNGQFTREQAATMILNTCKVIGMNVNTTSANTFADINTASQWAVNGINFCSENGIMNGTGNNNFSPKATYTREQSIVTFDNIK